MAQQAGAHRQRSTAQIALTGVGLIGIMALFLPFTAGVSPVDALPDMFGFLGSWNVVLPAFLPVLILPAAAGWLISGRLPRSVQAAAYLVSVASAATTLYFLLRPLSTMPEEFVGFVRWLTLLSPAAVLAVGALVLWRALKGESSSEYCPILALQVAYIANVALAMVGFFPDLQVGAYGVLATTLGYAIQIGLILKQPSVPPDMAA